VADSFEHEVGAVASVRSCTRAMPSSPRSATTSVARRRVVLLTVFRKTRSTETAEVERAVQTQKTCEAFHGMGAVPTIPVLDRIAAALGAELIVTIAPPAA
jgi:hypothetical protein